MVDSALCPRCSSPVVAGEPLCPNCGAPLSGVTAQPAAPEQASTGAVDRPGTGPDTPPSDLPGTATADPRLAALALGATAPEPSDASGESRPHDPSAPPVHMPGNWQIDLRAMAEEPAAPMMAEPQAAGETAGHVPGGYLAPSATYRASGATPPRRDPAVPGDQSTGPNLGASIGAVSIPQVEIGSPSGAVPQVLPPAPAILAPPIPTSVITPSPRPSAAPSDPPRPAGPTAAEADRKESVPELVAFGLVAAGGVVGFASLFLPWAGSAGIGIGTVASAGAPPQSNQWAWGMPAAIPLLLLTGLVLGAAAGSDRAQQRLPALASVIGRVTDVILPMVLAGLYFGVGLLYVTLPSQFGFGTGILVLIGAACLLLAGSIVALFFPPGDDSVQA